MSIRHRYQWLIGAVAMLLSQAFAPQAVAQADISLAGLGIELWPEYDRRDVLVIFRGQLDEDTQLPVDLTFALPARVETLNAVAVTAENGQLVNTPYETGRQGDQLLLTLTTNSRAFQFEYYDPGLLAKQNGQRALSFEFLPDYNVANLQLAVQEPFQSRSFVLTPPSTDVQVDQNGLRYHQLAWTEIKQGNTLELGASYERDTDVLSADVLIAQSETPAASPVGPVVTRELVRGYGLILLGGLLLLSVGGYWSWLRLRPGGGARPRRRRQAAKKAAADKTQPQKPTIETHHTYCHHCGTRLRQGAEFCHECGTKRR
jgi:hypothetical protein